MKADYTHAFMCYGMPVNLAVKIGKQGARAIIKEGKRHKFCRTCLTVAVREFRKTLIKELNGLGLK